MNALHNSSLCDITLMMFGGVVIPLRMLNVGVFSHLCNIENALAWADNIPPPVFSQTSQEKAKS